MNGAPFTNWYLNFSNDNDYFASFITVSGALNLKYMIEWLKKEFAKNKVIDDEFQVYFCHKDIKLLIKNSIDLEYSNFVNIWGESIFLDKSSFHHPIVDITENGKNIYSSNHTFASSFQGIVEPFMHGYRPVTIEEKIEGMKITFPTHTKFMQNVLDKVFIEYDDKSVNDSNFVEYILDDPDF